MPLALYVLWHGARFAELFSYRYGGMAPLEDCRALCLYRGGAILVVMGGVVMMR